MKTTNFLIGLIALTFFFTSCNKDEDRIVPSGNVTSVITEISEFNSLNVSDAFNVYVTFSDTEESLRIEASSNLHPYVQINEQGGTLFISFNDHVNIRNGSAVLNAYITTKMIEEYNVSGAVNIHLLNEQYIDNIDIVLTGASHFSGSLFAGNVTSSLYGASGLSLLGLANSFHIDATGASYMEGYNFVTDNLEADLEGASNISLTVEESLNVKASGASNVRYKGNGIVTGQHLSGSSGIIKVY